VCAGIYFAGIMSKSVAAGGCRYQKWRNPWLRTFTFWNWSR